ncbi:MAG: MFS transporter [Promethearchaeota archaeon]
MIKNQELEIENSVVSMISYGFANMSRRLVLVTFTTWIIFFYEVEIGLQTWFIEIGIMIFIIYNAIIGILIGYSTNRPFVFTPKLGRRFLLILIGGIPLGVCLFLFFSMDPIGSAWILFTYFVILLILFDTFHTLFSVNYHALFPDKFRSLNDRRVVSGIYVFLGYMGVILSAFITSLIIVFGDLTSYRIMGFIILVLFIFFFGIGIPGVREKQITKDLYLASIHEKAENRSFFRTIGTVFTQKSFIGFLIFFILFQIAFTSVMTSLLYVIRYVYELPYMVLLPLYIAMVIGIIIGVQFWPLMAFVTNNNRKIMLISAALAGVSLIPLFILRGFITIVIFMYIWGFALGGIYSMILPVVSDIIDESIVKTQKREEGIYFGIQQFIGRLALIIQAIIFTLVLSLTGFSSEPFKRQSPSAVLGIFLNLAGLPMVFILIGTLLFWILYDIKPEKVEENRLRIQELNL